MRSSRVVALSVAFALFSIADVAGAYCRTSVCEMGKPHTASVCDPPTVDDCGTPLAWPSPCAEFSIQQDGSPKLGITAAQMGAIMTTAFTTWDTAACSAGRHPLMSVTEGPAATCDLHEYNQDAGNANVILFHDDSWPYEGTANTLALTTVTYDLDNGQIYDADMELNSADTHFTTGNTDVDYDLLSVVTHESGHFQGLAHSLDMAATMWPSYAEHTTALRDLSTDDIAAICAAYPPGPAPSSCDPTPRHGFSPLCEVDQPASSKTSSSSGGCALSPASPADARSFGALIGAFALALGWRGRRRRR